MRLRLALLGVSAMIGIAAPAYADPGDVATDAAFLTALQQSGITYPSADQAIGAAQAVCTCLNHGESGLELVHDVKTHNPAFTMDAAAQFAAISAKYYCPQQLSKS
ncbi:DUF732 domain-containing protein [Mycobacterium heckeshornense]|uniref:Uncharacterized protein n=2 Tax=Mycobacterium heckeshornense TaxID=110505 RepID=A0A2G8BDC5_9MYCO|nr:DUF732 domain-containing protein [Mycobacterium heckeshornense]HZS20032.1 DUF732 domain-containing protein [Pseudonocardiaceae bacterium]KMV21511.1 glycine cleavage system P protein [Mycobacterium heckeshornense]MCV7035854.1 DUF732 domain-containing protein [Mycobacterium heckeshornense]PIJ35783.1 DUF732 domain-containing protein [Mycobacterium heckeshornense]BCO35956.1 hypothetical protein MHEC_23890 [Mycobacterium heckeshornense]